MFKLAPALPELQPTFWELHHWAMLGASAGGLLVLALLMWLVSRPGPAVVVLPETLARDALGKLAGRPEDGDCLSQISQILRHYFIAAFQLPEKEMTTAEMTTILATNESIGVDLGSQISLFLRECDQRKFTPAPVPASGAVNRALELVNLGEARRTQLNQLQKR